MKRVLIVSETFWPEGGGAELATYLISRILAREAEITIATGTENPARVERARIIHIPQLGYRRKQLLWANILLNRSLFEKLIDKHDIIYIPRFSLPIIPIAKKHEKRVIVHLHDYIPISYTAAVLAPAEEADIERDDIRIECYRGLLECAGIRTLKWITRYARKWTNQADKIICVSNRQADIIKMHAQELSGKIILIYNPNSQNIIQNYRKNSKLTLIYTRGSDPFRGYALLNKILYKLIERLDNETLHIVMAGLYKKQDLNRLRKISKYIKIINTGFIDRKTLLYYVSRSHVLLLPTLLEEPSPYTLIESMHAGTIPIASKAGGIPEIADETIAEKYLCPPNQLDCFVDKINKIASMDKKYIHKISIELRDQFKNKINNKQTEKLIKTEILE